MIDTILFDLDGTLVRMSQDDFLEAYLTKLSKVFLSLELNPEEAIKALWIGTKVMVQNDGSVLNSVRFWDTFSSYLKLDSSKKQACEAACDNFYSNEFNEVKSITNPTDVSKRVVQTMKAKGYCVVLATNPVFPLCALESRLKWIGLDVSDFKHVTYYTNSSFCKPNLGYYKEVLTKINKKPEQCLMIGNSPAEDMCISALGADTFLVTGYLESAGDFDIFAYKNGSPEELEEYLMSLPDC